MNNKNIYEQDGVHLNTLETFNMQALLKKKLSVASNFQCPNSANVILLLSRTLLYHGITSDFDCFEPCVI